MAGFLLVCLLAAPDTEALALEYLRAEPLRRQAILEELEPVDVITAEEVAAWRTKLLKAASRGTKLRKRGRNYFYDKKEKRGKYIVGGSKGTGGLLIGLHGGGRTASSSPPSVANWWSSGSARRAPGGSWWRRIPTSPPSRSPPTASYGAW